MVGHKDRKANIQKKKNPLWTAVRCMLPAFNCWWWLVCVCVYLCVGWEGGLHDFFFFFWVCVSAMCTCVCMCVVTGVQLPAVQHGYTGQQPDVCCLHQTADGCVCVILILSISVLHVFMCGDVLLCFCGDMYLCLCGDVFVWWHVLCLRGDMYLCLWGDMYLCLCGDVYLCLCGDRHAIVCWPTQTHWTTTSCMLPASNCWWQALAVMSQRLNCHRWYVQSLFSSVLAGLSFNVQLIL